MDELKLTNLHNLQVNVPVTIENLTKGTTYEVTHNLSALDIETILAGGTLNLIRKNQ